MAYRETTLYEDALVTVIEERDDAIGYLGRRVEAKPGTPEANRVAIDDSLRGSVATLKAVRAGVQAGKDAARLIRDRANGTNATRDADLKDAGRQLLALWDAVGELSKLGLNAERNRQRDYGTAPEA